MASSGPSRPSARTSIAALVVGVVLLALMVAFAVGLPRLSSGEGGPGGSGDSGGELAALPDTLPGGFVDLAGLGGPEGGDAAAIGYVNDVLDDVYPDEATQFRAYVDEEDQALVTLTLFAAPGGAFSPPEGVADAARLGLERAPTELSREGDAVCESNYQSGAAAAGGSGDAPLSISCQRPLGETTVQLASQGLDLDQTVALLDDLVQRLDQG